MQSVFSHTEKLQLSFSLYIFRYDDEPQIEIKRSEAYNRPIYITLRI